MSFQFQPPGSPPPPPTPAVAPPPPPMPADTPPKRLLLGLGAVVLVGGLATGGVFFGKSASAVDDTVARFARAPMGCTTTLEFDRSDTFTIFVETKGSSADVGGDCKGNGGAFEHSGSDVPKVNVALLDDQDRPVDLTSYTGTSYSTDHYRGSAVSKVTITKPGTYRLTVTSDASDVGVAVGGDPEADASRMKMIALGSALGGLLVGGALMVMGRPRKRHPASAAPPPVLAPPTTGWGAPS